MANLTTKTTTRVGQLLKFILFTSVILVISCEKKTLDTNNSLYPSKISNYSRAQWKLIYALLTPEEKQAEWIGHIKHGITQIPTSREQLVFVNELLKNDITAAFFNTSLPNSETELFILESKIKTIFPNKMHYIYLFGGLENNYDVFSASYLSLLAERVSRINLCNCASQSDFCPGAMSCKDNVICEKSAEGCGLFWQYDCNSICK